MAHLTFLGDHYDDTLWGVGLYLEAFLAAVAVGLALVARRVTGSARRRSRLMADDRLALRG
jgi:hypothetical protein